MSPPSNASFRLVKESSLKRTSSIHGEMVYFKNDDCIGRCLELYGEWAGLEIDLLKQFIAPGDVVLDVGANIGTHSLSFAKLVGPRGHVYSVEAHPQIQELLRANVSENNLKNVTIVAAGAGKEPGEISVRRTDQTESFNIGAITLVSADDDDDTDDDDREKQSTSRAEGDDYLTTQIMPLDDLGVVGVKFIKLDVEGMELAALQGADRMIARDRPLIYAECRLIAEGAVLVDWAKARGFQVFFASLPAYNPQNIRNYRKDIFRGGCEAALVIVPPERVTLVESMKIPPKVEWTPIGDVDQLANALLRVPKTAELSARERMAPMPTRRMREPKTQKNAWRRFKYKIRNFFSKISTAVKRRFGVKSEWDRISDELELN